LKYATWSIGFLCAAAFLVLFWDRKRLVDRFVLHHDIDGDGEISPVELVHGVHHIHRAITGSDAPLPSADHVQKVVDSEGGGGLVKLLVGKLTGAST